MQRGRRPSGQDREVAAQSLRSGCRGSPGPQYERVQEFRRGIQGLGQEIPKLDVR